MSGNVIYQLGHPGVLKGVHGSVEILAGMLEQPVGYVGEVNFVVRRWRAWGCSGGR